MSKRFTAFDEAHAALGIKDEADTQESEIDKRLGLGVSSISDRPLPHPTLAGSTGSTFSNSSCLDSSPSSTDGSVYGGVVLRRTGTQHSLHSSPTLPSPARCSDTISDFQSSVLDSVFSSTLPRNSGASGLRSSSQVSETSGDGTLQRGCDSGSLGELRISLPPAKPARKKSLKKEDLAVDSANTNVPKQQFRFTRGYSLPAFVDPEEDKQGKRKRFTSADFLTRSVRVKGERKSDSFAEEDEEPKIRNRFSSIYRSMRVGKRRTNRQSSAGSDITTVSESPTDSKALRLLEETMCEDPQKLLADRVRELRKVGDPDNPAGKTQSQETEEFPLFEFVCEVSVRQKGENLSPYISWSHPPLRVLEEEKDNVALITLNIPTFCFPDLDIVEPVKKLKTETYCFVFTDLQAQNKFGYCRRFLPAAKNTPPQKRFPVVYCMVTKLRSFETFSKVFDQVVKLRDFSSAGAYSFLKSLVEQNAPKPGRSITVKYISPKIGNLVDIHVERLTAGHRFEHIDLAHVLAKLGSKLLVEIFVNLLVERKLLFVAESLSDLTSIIHSIMQLFYPLHWQGIYIPVLPQEIIDATSSPVPFVIGILKQHVKLIDEESLDDECNTVYIAEKKIVKRPNFTDIPFNKKYRKKFLQELKVYKSKVVKAERSASQTIEIGDMFFEFMRTIIGHYSDHVTFEGGESDIDLTAFSDSAGLHSEFVWQLSKTQMFSSFIQSLTEESKNPFEEKPDVG